MTNGSLLRTQWVAIFAALVVPCQLRGADPPSPKASPSATAPSYADDIRPLLQSKCSKCHGDKVRKADLDLTSPAGILKGGESGRVVVPGKPDESLLYEKVHTGAMPPKKEGTLTASEIETIRRWITAGAKTQSATEAATEVTQHDVAPVLFRHCTACHGRHRQENGLDLRTKAGILRGGKSGPAIVPGKPDESLLVKKIRAGQMPPKERLVEASVKPVDAAETDLLVKWIAAGAPEVAVEADVATTKPDPLVTDKDRAFWAFRPPRAGTVPSVRDAHRVRNPIDAFLLEKLAAKGIGFSPEADRVTLARRVAFDLTGLPLDPAEVQALVADSSPDAYERLVDRLLASPRYAERWARRWLDLAGYADSEGKREQDLPRPHAWRYRDYVIRTFNTNKPYDRFLLEQIAGDELADCEKAPEITPALYDNLVATAFLRMAPDGTWANITNYVPDRLEVIADEIDVLGSTVLGLTMKCARCHGHKFDPIPQRDYYRLLAVFKGAYDEYDWLKPDVKPGLGPVSQDFVAGRLLPHVTTAERRAWEERDAAARSEIDAIKAPLDRKAETLTAKYFDEPLAKLPAALHVDLKKMLATPPDQRDAVQRYLAEKFEKDLRIDREVLKTLDAGFKKEAEAVDTRVRELESRRTPEPKIQALWDRGDPSPTYMYRRGEPTSPVRLVGPGVPSVLTDGKTPFQVTPPWPGSTKTGRRLAFAKWLTQPDHPLTARVMVNRLWKHHFGRGIVSTLGNFGRAGSPPTHPELLDWLAVEFVRQGWDIKAMHRLMVTSTAYRQTSNLQSTADNRQSIDPDNALVSRMPLTRLDAEALYDTLLLAAGRLDETPFGPSDTVQVRSDGLVTPAGIDRGWRRLIYVQQTRKQIPTHLETFDYPQMNPNCIERRDSTVATQALYLMNNAMVDRLAGDLAIRVRREAGDDPPAQVERVYWIALGRGPTKDEKDVTLQALQRFDDDKALQTICRAVVNSAAFLYVD
jgi:mono/diheme cytochrome c family protein